MAKVTTVPLVCIETGDKTEFGIDHAERILNIMDSGWELPEGSEFEFKDGTIIRRSKKADK